MHFSFFFAENTLQLATLMARHRHRKFETYIKVYISSIFCFCVDYIFMSVLCSFCLYFYLYFIWALIPEIKLMMMMILITVGGK